LSLARPQDTRRQGRQKYRWADGVVSDSQALGAKDLTIRGQDTEQWKLVVALDKLETQITLKKI